MMAFLRQTQGTSVLGKLMQPAATADVVASTPEGLATSFAAMSCCSRRASRWDAKDPGRTFQLQPTEPDRRHRS